MQAMSRRNQPKPEDFEHTPLLAMWYQIRHALADLIIPLLAGLKALWLMFFAPVTFFKAVFFHTRDLESLRSPADPLWRTFSPEARRPLDPAPFLLFGILTAALANFEFDNSNRLLGLLGDSESGVMGQALTTIAQRSASMAQVINGLRDFWTGAFMTELRAFFDASLFGAITELIANLVILVVFAYIFYLLTRRRMTAVQSYAFWLYMAGLQFFTTAVSHLFFSIFSLSAFSLPPIAPEIIFIVMETGLLIVWQLLYPAYVLPKVFPDILTAKKVLVAAVIGRLLLAALAWLLFGGFVIILSFLS
jgi:hypothetical protein